MAQQIFDLIRHYLAEYGYWAVAVALLLENAGLPVPGETVLLLASFLAYSEHRLHLPYVILVGIAAASFGDNLGFALGHFGGRPLLDRYSAALRISPRAIEKGEDIFRRYGPITVSVARFIGGLRIFAGPLAGVLRMHWKKFVIYNLLGAVLWVTTISCVGYIFGRHWETLERYVGGSNFLLLFLAILVAAFLWYRKRRESRSDLSS
jgi:membrane-associated protein